jgi:hypothetical protein
MSESSRLAQVPNTIRIVALDHDRPLRKCFVPSFEALQKGGALDVSSRPVGFEVDDERVVREGRLELPKPDVGSCAQLVGES